jgi:hypothetical protein
MNINKKDDWKLKETFQPVGEPENAPAVIFSVLMFKERTKTYQDFIRDVPGYLFRWNVVVFMFKELFISGFGFDILIRISRNELPDLKVE